MPRKPISILVFVLLLSLWALPAAAQDGDTQSYTSSDGSFSFDYPATWVTNNDRSGRVFLTRSADILEKSYSELIPGEFILQVQAPLFTQELVQTPPDADASVVMAALLDGLGDGVTLLDNPAPLTLGGRDVIQSRVSAGEFEVLLLAVTVGEGESSSVGLVFAFVPPGALEAATEAAHNIAATMRYERPLVNRANLSPLTPGNGDQLAVLSIWPGHYDGVRGAAISPDGTRIASVDESSVLQVRDTQTGAIIHEEAFEQIISAGPVFMPNSERLLLGSINGEVLLWDIRTGEIVLEFPAMSDTVWDLAVSPDGETVVGVGRDLTARAWDVPSGELRVIMSGHRDDVVSVAFAGDADQIFTASLDGTLRLWNIETGNQMLLIPGSNSGLTAVAVNPAGTLVAAATGNGALYMWDVASQEQQWVFAEDDSNAAPLQALSFSPDGALLLAAGQDGSMRVWEAAGGLPITVLAGPSFMNDVVISSDGRLVIGANDAGVLIVWGVQ